MAQAEAFETDFWKHANLRKVWDDIVPGVPRQTIPYTLTRDAIELYCASVGEDHPIYFDEAYHYSCRFALKCARWAAAWCALRQQDHAMMCAG